MTNNLVPLLLFAFSASFTPGPNNIMIMDSGMNFGLKKSLPHYFGICLGFPLMCLMVALGLGAIFVKYAWVKEFLKILGSIYMLYLSWKILTSHSKKNFQLRKPFHFLQAVIFQWINPKAWLMGIGTISIFTISNNYLANAILISCIYFLIGVPCVGSWLLFGNYLNRILTKDSHRVWFNIIMALALVASIGMIWLD